MALSISSPASANSPSSTDGSAGPQTPVSPANSVQTLALPPAADGQAAAPSSSPVQPTVAPSKRKPSRRANTAERRATHNAVERARRETLNSRFLDLAALLPNLSQIRRPSKSSIVNSSIAHIHASRRHRLLAARELRLLKLESDALRRELNEWRDRSNVPRIDEPVRGEAFQMILSGEIEVLNPGPIEEEGDGDDYDDEGMQDDQQPMEVPLLKASPDMTNANVFAHNVPQQAQRGPGLQLQTMLPRQGHGPHTPIIVGSPSVPFENPAMGAHGMYDGQMHPAHPAHGLAQAYMGHDEKWPGMFTGHGMFTPPASSHGHGPHAQHHAMSAQQQQQAFLASLQRQQQMRGRDESSEPMMIRRERSGSINSNGSGYTSPASSYEVPNVMHGRGWDDGMHMMPGMNMGMLKPSGQPIAVGGGGNGHGYAAMMM